MRPTRETKKTTIDFSQETTVAFTPTLGNKSVTTSPKIMMTKKSQEGRSTMTANPSIKHTKASVSRKYNYRIFILYIYSGLTSIISITKSQ
jgi:hypothetical protein